MTQDKRGLYVWIFAILANVGTCLYTVYEALNTGRHAGIHGLSLFLEAPITHNTLHGTVWISILITLVPIYISGLHFKYKNIIGYVISLSIIVYSVVAASTCGEYLCSLLYLPVGILGVISLVFFALGIYLRKWPTKISAGLLIIEIVLIIGAVVWLRGKSDANEIFSAKMSDLGQQGTQIDVIEAVKICDTTPKSKYDSLRGSCWEKTIRAFPNVNVCNLSTNTESYKQCMHFAWLYYTNICEGTDADESFSKRDDPSENLRLVDCWIERTKVYEPIDVCYFSYEWNREKCRAARDSVPISVGRTYEF